MRRNGGVLGMRVFTGRYDFCGHLEVVDSLLKLKAEVLTPGDQPSKLIIFSFSHLAHLSLLNLAFDETKYL